MACLMYFKIRFARCRQGEGLTYRICDSAGYWNGPKLRCVGA